MRMRRLLGLAALGVSTLVVLVGAPAQAMAGRCSNVCRSTTACDLACRGDDFDWTTCGDYGVCNDGGGGPTCTPNWQNVSSQGAGYVHYNDYGINQCNTFAMTRITQQDVNNCDPNNSQRFYCTSQLVQAASGCCWFGCSPQILDESNCH